jgi:hypothetical protein
MKILLAVFAVLLPAAPQDVALRAGAARADITPSTFGPMYGYANRKCGPAVGVHDPLYAKALVLAAGDMKAAIVTLDLGSMVSERLKRMVSEKLGISVLLLAASHSHSTPLFLPPGGEPTPYLAEAEGKIFGAVEEAAARLEPARLSVASGSLRLGYNRLLPEASGRSRALFNNLERIPYGPVDPEFTLLRVSSEGGRPLALLVHYATHAVVLGPTNCKYSADYPGVLQARVEQAMPGVQCMFVQGGAGDVNPLFMARSGKENEDFDVVRKMGETLAGEVVKVARTMPEGAPNRHGIQSVSETMEFPDRWEAGKKVSVGITTLLIDRSIAIAATPGEPMHRLQTEWKAKAEVAHPLFYGYTYSGAGEWPGYIPDLRSAAHGGYGADVTTRIAIGAGETIVQRHLANLYRMLGMWLDQPGRP